jgi:flagellar biosynthesis GTPase FlhF
MNVLKRNVLAAALLSTALMASAVWAQEVSVDGKDFLSGAGDAKLADLARQAASEGKHLVVTAPNYWQSKVAAKLHAGAANVEVQMKEGFFENVVVRIEDGKAKAEAAAADAKAAAAKVEAQKTEAARAEAARLEAARVQAEREESARAEAAKAEAARAEAARQEAARQEAARAEAARAEAARQESAKAAAAAAAAKAKAEKDAADKLAAQKKALLQNLNGGRDAEGTISASQMQKDDQVFVDGQFRAVVRRAGARTQLFWLDGDLNLDRIELLPLGENHYKVNEAIRENAPVVLRTKSVTGHIAATVPATDAPERKSLEQQYAEGKSVTETIRPTDLRSGDLVYTAKSSAIVVRLQGTSYLRYWLDGDLNFGQAGLQKQGPNAYRVLSDTIH